MTSGGVEPKVNPIAWAPGVLHHLRLQHGVRSGLKFSRILTISVSIGGIRAWKVVEKLLNWDAAFNLRHLLLLPEFAASYTTIPCTITMKQAFTARTRHWIGFPLKFAMLRPRFSQFGYFFFYEALIFLDVSLVIVHMIFDMLLLLKMWLNGYIITRNQLEPWASVWTQ